MPEETVAITRQMRLGHGLMVVVVALLLAGNISALGQYMPTETDPIASGFYLSNTSWYKDGKAVTDPGATEFRVIGGKPFWKSGTQYYYNNMGSFSATDWVFRGACTSPGATCFFVFGGNVFYQIGSTYFCNSLSTYTSSTRNWGRNGSCTLPGALDFRVVGGNVFYRIGSTYYYNSLSTYTPSTSSWGSNGPCTLPGALEFEVFGRNVFYRIGSTYYYNSLSTYASDVISWGGNGPCTQAGASNFRVSNGRPYWNLGMTFYRNGVTSFSLSSNTWSTITSVDGPLPPPDNPDLSYDPCAYAYTPIPPSAPTGMALSSSTVAENQPPGTPVGSLGTADPNPGDTFSYALVSGVGSEDNGSFTINGGTLLTAALFDYEAMSSFSIRARTTDQVGLWYEEAFTITVLDQQALPFQITAIDYDEDPEMITLTWDSRKGYFYTVFHSRNLQALGTGVGDDIASDGETTSFTFPNPEPVRSRLFFRVRENE